MLSARSGARACKLLRNCGQLLPESRPCGAEYIPDIEYSSFISTGYKYIATSGMLYIITATV
jgi:hypothetical protein